MAIVTINKKQFEREIGKLDEKMQEKIAFFGTPVEDITKNELQIEIFPNRPDLLSYQGFKRAFLAFLGRKTGLKEYKINPHEKDYKIIVDSSVKKVRPYTVCAIVKKLKLNDEKIKELIDIQEKLHATIGRKRKKLAIGIYPLEKIKLPITFKALEPDRIKFIPLESKREMSGLQILQRHKTGREYAHLLAGKSQFPIFIDSAQNILSMPPIINSQLTGKITEKAKEVFIECSGSDLNILKKCLNILITILSEMGGKIYSMKVGKETTPNLTPEKMHISLENTNKLLGIKLNKKELKKCLEKMGYNYDGKQVSIPMWRTDILHEVDLIEDVAIAYGYENFKPEIPKISTIGKEDKKEGIKRKISEILAGLGILEISNYHLTNKRDQLIAMGKNEKDNGVIEIEESKTNYNILRKDLAHYLLKILSENIDSEYPQKIFETGTVFEPKDKEINEIEKLALANAPGNFTETKQILGYLARMLEIELKLEDVENFPEYFIKGRVAKIKIGHKDIGFLGEIHPRILKNWKIKMPVSIFEINLEEIFKKLK